MKTPTDVSKGCLAGLSRSWTIGVLATLTFGVPVRLTLGVPERVTMGVLAMLTFGVLTTFTFRLLAANKELVVRVAIATPMTAARVERLRAHFWLTDGVFILCLSLWSLLVLLVTGKILVSVGIFFLVEVSIVLL